MPYQVFGVVGELEWCECGAFGALDFFLCEKIGHQRKSWPMAKHFFKAPHSHHSSSPTTPIFPLKIAHDVERPVTPSAPHPKLNLQ